MKKILALLSVLLMLLCLASCKKEEDVKHKTGWQNPAEPSSTEEATAAEDTETTYINATEAAATEAQKITFNKEKAIEAGSFNSEIYGKLTVYFQDEYFLLTDEYGDLIFTVFAEGFSTAKTEGKAIPLFGDMNFDGYTDFGICYYKDALNSYYFCFLWNNSVRSFDYYLPLSSLPNPDFNTENKSVTALEKLTTTKAVEKTYRYASAELTYVSSKEIINEPETDSAEPVDANLQIVHNGNSALLILRATENSHSKWVCTVEDESIAIISSEHYDPEANAYEFLLSSVSPGATTVIFRYAAVGSGDYIEEVIVNAITNTDSTISVIVP